MSGIVNKGTGAGGANTNVTGKSFEEATNNESRLLAKGFERKQIPGSKAKNAFYLEKVDSSSKRVVYLTQSGLKAFFAHFHKKELGRCPDEAYLFQDGDSYTLNILEKKNQNVAGSVDTKLLAGPGFIYEYQYCLGPAFKVQYAFCISKFLKKDYISEAMKYKALREFNKEHGIAVLFGDDADYYATLDAWTGL
jgi:hypothetical protein